MLAIAIVFVLVVLASIVMRMVLLMIAMRMRILTLAIRLRAAMMIWTLMYGLCTTMVLAIMMEVAIVTVD